MASKKKKRDHYKNRRWLAMGAALFVVAIFYFLSLTFPVLSFSLPSYLLALGILVLIMFFYIVDHAFDIKFTLLHYIFFIIIISSGIMLSSLYYVFPFYDKILHFILPIMLFFIILHIALPIRTSIKLRLALTFFVVISLLGFFEVVEYMMDTIFDFTIQGVYLWDANFENLELIQSKIDDTMSDLIIGIVATIISVILTLVYYKAKLKIK